VLDEAQDLSPMECRAIGRRCATGSVTVLGDLAQSTAPAAVGSWPGMLAQLGKSGAEVRVLETGYRVPRQILDYANQLLSALAPGLAPARSLRQDPGALTVRHASADALPAALAAAGAAALGDPGSTAVIAADDQVPSLTRMLGAAGVRHSLLDGSVDALASGGLLVVPVTLAKGLEFDHVIVVEPGRIAAAEARGLHRLYVALTRAVSRLTVLHAEPLPALLC
jgi:DNA helicase IV